MVTDAIKSIAIDLPRPAAGGNPAVRSLQQASSTRGVAGGTAQAEPRHEVEVEELQEAVRDLNSYVNNIQRNLQFSVDEGSGHTIIRVIDAATEQVVRQIPSEEVLALASHLKEMSGTQASGLLVRSIA